MEEQTKKKVFVSGCYDLFHSGHLMFLETASKYGNLFVSIGSDETILGLKGKKPVYNERERLYLIKGLKCVKDAFIARGSGVIDFINELEEIKPDILIVNKDGDKEEKRKLCERLGINYIVLDRIPNEGLPTRSSTDIKREIAKNAS